MGEGIKLLNKAHEGKKENSAACPQKNDLSQSKTGPDRNVFFLRAIGNQAVQRLFKSGVIRTKLIIGRPGDIYEQEADTMAEQVMGMPEPDMLMKAT